MKQNAWLNLMFAVMLFSTSCAVPAPASTATPTGVTAPAPPGYALLMIAKGEVQLKRTGWGAYYPASFGAELRQGDLLNPAADAVVFVICNNLLIWNVPVGVPSGVSSGCPQGNEPPMVSKDSQIINTRGADDTSIPYIISPRFKNLLNAAPTFRWNPVSDASRYTVNFLREDQLEWSVQTDQTELVYPEDKPNLMRGTAYSWYVTTDNEKSSRDENTPFLSFQLLDEATQKVVVDRTEKLANSHIPADEKAYATAWVYNHYGLYAEAIDILELQIASGSQNSAVYRLLGELYHQVALPVQARANYEKALELAKDTGDIENLAQVQYKLGIIYNKLGEKALSGQFLSQARDGYRQLGDTGMIEKIEKYIGNK